MTALIDRDGVAYNADARVASRMRQPHVGAIDQLGSVAHRTNGIPQSQKPDRTATGESGLKFRADRRPAIRAGMIAPPIVHGVTKKVFGSGVQQADRMEHRGDGPCGVGASAEAEDVYVVALLERLHEEAV